MKPFPLKRTRFGAIRAGLFCLALCSGIAAHAQTNAWLKSTSGQWEEPEWSLGRLPGSGHAVLLTNAGWKAVAIGPNTVANYPASLTIGSLVISAPETSLNSLLLNFAGTDVPLKIEEDAVLGANGRLVSQSSGFSVGGNLMLVNAEFDQDGGATTVGGLFEFDGGYYLTNGLLQAAEVSVAMSNNANFFQYGGRADIGSLYVGRAGVPPLLSDGWYFLYDGLLTTANLEIGGGAATTARFRQEGGTNQSSRLSLKAMGAPSRYELIGGRLQTDETGVFGSPYNTSYFGQEGGWHVVSGTLNIRGGIRTGFMVYPGTYELRGGEIAAATLFLGEYGVYKQTNGTVETDHLVLSGGSSFVRMEAILAGGVVRAGSVDHGSLGVDVLQTDGTLDVAGTFAFGGIGPYGVSYARYRLLGGQLLASNIDLSADLLVDGGPGRISNPGYFKLWGAAPTGGTLTLSNTVEHLGRLIVQGPANLFLGGAAAKALFEDSAAETWGPYADLLIFNWNGAVNGGGPDQVVFGANAASLRSDQLGHIHFVDAAGFPGTNSATLLSTGEIVPSRRPALSVSRSGQTLIIAWIGNYSLERATNVSGPYEPVTGATSPYPMDTSLAPRAFFRLQSP